VLGASGKRGVIGNPSKARNFIGLPASQVNIIVEQVRGEFPAQGAAQEVEEQSARTAFIQQLLNTQGVSQ